MRGIQDLIYTKDLYQSCRNKTSNFLTLLNLPGKRTTRDQIDTYACFFLFTKAELLLQSE